MCITSEALCDSSVLASWRDESSGGVRRVPGKLEVELLRGSALQSAGEAQEKPLLRNDWLT